MTDLPDLPERRALPVIDPAPMVEALRRIKYEVISLADAQVIAFQALSLQKPHAMTTAERAAWVRGHSAGWDAARGLDADMPRHLADGNEIEPQ